MYAYCANDPVNYVDPSGHKLIAHGANWELYDSRPSICPKEGWKSANTHTTPYKWKGKLIAAAIKKAAKTCAKKCLIKCLGKGIVGAVVSVPFLNVACSKAIVQAIGLYAAHKKGKITVNIKIIAKDQYSESGALHWLRIQAKLYNKNKNKVVAKSKKMYLYERMGAC